MRLSELVVQGQCLERQPPSLGVSFAGWFMGVLAQYIGVSKSRVSQRIIRVALNGLLKVLPAFGESVLCIFGKKVPTSYIQLIRIRVVGVSSRHSIVQVG